MTQEENARLLELQGSMTPKQNLFLAAYTTNGYNGADAIRKAGYETPYPNKMGAQVLNNKKVKEAFQLMQKKAIESISISPDYVVKKLVKTVEKAELENNHTAVLRGLELIAKHLGMFIERTEISGKDGEAIQLERVSNEAADFARTISSLARRGGKGEVPSDTLN